MRNPVRQPQKVFTLTMWVLSLLFAACLVGLGSLVIRDLPRVEGTMQMEDFVDQKRMEAHDASIASMEVQLEDLHQLKEDEQAEVFAAQADYQAAQDNFEAWLANRTVTEADEQNAAVVERTRQVEEKRLAVREETADVEAVGAQAMAVTRQLQAERVAKSELWADARPAYEAANARVRNRVFLYRLAVTLPLLIIAGFMLARFRGSKYWPLYRGFIVAAAFAFFVELVPYMPSYGGYVRYGAGVVAIIIAGHFVIKAMQGYLERQKTAEAKSESERRKSIAYETALSKMNANTCPGCDRSIVHKDGMTSDYCVHCGLRLEADCGNCGTHKIAFHKFCLACGHDCREDHDMPVQPEASPA